MMGAPLNTILDAIGAKEPTPGGGAVAAWMGATGAALGLMVVGYSEGRREEHDAALATTREALQNARLMFMELAEEDAAAYEALSGVLKLPKGDPKRRERLGPAVDRAIQAPSAVAATGLNVLRLMEDLAGRANPYLRSDLGVAAGAVEAAIGGAIWMVRANMPLVKDSTRRTGLGEAIEGWSAQASAMRGRIDQQCL